MCETPPRRPNPREPGRPCRNDGESSAGASEAARFIDERSANIFSGIHEEGRGQHRLHIVTWNVWYGPFESHRRWACLLAEVLNTCPDVVGLQEVTEEFREILRQSSVIRNLYTISNSYLGGFCNYDVVLMVRRGIIVHRWWSIDDLPTEMGRRCLGVDLEFAGTAVRIANIHLESSKPKGPERRQQLEQVMASLTQMQMCFSVLVGDMNFCSTWLDENSYLDKNFVDIWPLLHGCDKPGFTENTEINLMRLQTTKKSKQVRFDRILVARASEQQRWHARSIDLLGTHEICKAGRLSGEGELSVFPSDHFGLSCIFEYV